MIDENNFVSEIEKKISDWNAEIVKFRMMSNVGDPGDQSEHYQLVEDLTAKENAVMKKHAAFEESGAVDRSDLKGEIEDLQQNLEDAIKAPRVKITS
jgi:capsule polysaccharide export protein KpsE/RkpR